MTATAPRSKSKPKSTSAASHPHVAEPLLLGFLLNPKSYPHQPRVVRFVQTHSSFVFLVSPFVYKVKKAVNFGFLDYSTLEKRRFFCEREVALNRRLSPKAYLGVVPITLQGGQLILGGDGEIVEYAVKMRKLSERYFLDRWIQRRQASTREINRIVSVLRRFYQAEIPTTPIQEWGRIHRLKISTDENFRQTEPFIGKTVSSLAFDAIQFYVSRFYRTHTPLFETRIQQGWIRDCHGDLHLEHIHLTPQEIQIYDCIEFNDRFRYVDVASDVAFLAMDLDYEDRADLSRLFIHKMARALHDPDMLRLIDFYKCYRAYVRGKVESLHSIAPTAPEAERTASAERARRYFRLALQYTLAGSHPLVLIVMGRIASGKSTLAQALAVDLGWDVISSDRVRKETAGFPLYERTAASARSRLYSEAMTRLTYKKLLTAALGHAHSGSSVILDATFAQRSHREFVKTALKNKGIPYLFIEARVNDGTVKRRLRDRERLATEISDARLEDFKNLTSHYQPPTELSPQELLSVIASGPLPKTLLRVIKGIQAADATRSSVVGASP